MKSLLAIIFLATGVLALADDDERRLALENPELFEGDILGIDPEDRNVISYKQMRWPNAYVPFIMHPSLSDDRDVREILLAMWAIMNHTCVEFHPAEEDDDNYLFLYKGEGCNSYVGMKGGPQTLSLGDGCIYRGTIIHELGHALGLFHEHNRSDRDKYVKIFWNNIAKENWSQFKLLPPHMNILYTDFDYSSIMIYGNNAFSKDGRSMTMRTYNGIRLDHAYEKTSLSRSDIYKINKMYNCYRNPNA